MDSPPRKLPFATSFQFRDDERAGFEALFLRAFFDVPFSPAARKALARTRFRRAAAQGQPASPAEAPASSAGGRQDDGVDLEPGEGARHVLLYRGADGIGKTRVFRQFRESASAKRIPVYEVNHHDVEGIPFKPFLHAIRAILGDHDQGALLADKYRHGLESVLPELYAQSPSAEEPAARPETPYGDPPAQADEAGKVRIFDAITQLLLEVTTQRPLLLLVHDLHWSDRPTIELLDYIGRNLKLRSDEPAVRALGQDPLLGQVVRGPELDDFDSDEWRTLGPTGQQALDLLGVQYYAFPLSSAPGETGAEGAADRRDAAGPPGLAGDKAEEAPSGGLKQVPRPRLMIVANYRQFAEASHYLEQALLALGEQPFAYHGELRPLTRAETDVFVERCLEGVEIEGAPVDLDRGAIDAVYEAAEGFPSFMQELFRAMYLREGSLAGPAGARSVWSGDAVRSALGAVPPAGLAGSPPEEDRQPLGRRHAILRLRLDASSAAERRVLEAMAILRRPAPAALICKLLEGHPSSGESLAAIDRLRERGILGSAEAQDCCLFRLWDYTCVVEDAIPAEERRRLHQRVGEEYLSGLEGESDEGAFEVFYHLSRGLEPRSAVPSGLIAARRLVRSFALVKARQVYGRLVDLLAAPEDLPLRLGLLEQIARISIGLKEPPAAGEALRRAQAEGAAVLEPERRVELILLEAEAARALDPARGLKILGKAPKLLKDENTRLGVRLQLATARLRLERQDSKRAINFCLKGASICQKVGDVPELGDLYRVMASAFYRKGDYSHAVDNYQRALDAFERMGLREASVGALDELGRVYLERGNHFRAARFLYKSLEIRRRHHDLPGLCRSYDELGRVYLRSGDYLKTIENLNRSLALKERIGDLAGLNPTLVILGDLYFRLGRYEQALLYFNREVQNSQKLGDTRGLVEAFGQLGRVYFELGDLKQAETYSKQVSILATEFKLKSQEADGALLEGSLRALVRDWAGAEKSFKLAAEVHGKLGHRRREVCAYLDLAEVKLARDLYDEALKYASKGQIIADEVRAVDLQVRALTIKGNIHRFLKGGNIEKARELLHKGLELSRKLNDASPRFQLYYSVAKVCHSAQEFAEAASFYSKAEQLLKQTAERLPEERAARFFEDKRRKVFAEDLARFRKEALGRASSAGVDLRAEPAAQAGGDRPVGFADYKDLSCRVLRVHRELNQLHFHERLLAEAVELTGADRGLVLRVQNRQYFPVTFHGFGKAPAQHPELQPALSLAQDAVRKGHAFLASAPREPGASGVEKGEPPLPLEGLGHRSVLVVPFMTDERIFGAVYLDKPTAVGQFLPRDLVLLEAFAQHAAVALWNRKEFETAIREPVTGFYTPSYFIERLREAYRWFNLHGKSFTLIGYYLPSLEDALGDGRGELAQSLSRSLAEPLPHGAAVCWGSPVLCILLGEADLALQDEIAAAVRERLQTSLGEEVPMVVLPAHNRYQQGAEIYVDLRRRLLPEVSDRKVLAELRALLAKDISLREAKLILEKHKIESTLRKTGGNITHAARQLGIHRPQLSNLLKKHALRREVFEMGVNGEDDEEPEAPEPSDN
ncbi:MAG: tetratricopeptide repeat protein [Planctomycetes bacterium]|nr:tetratricopeptide repeat protein [Planctomycetota bacterium]